VGRVGRERGWTNVGVYVKKLVSIQQWRSVVCVGDILVSCIGVSGEDFASAGGRCRVCIVSEEWVCDGQWGIGAGPVNSVVLWV